MFTEQEQINKRKNREHCGLYMSGGRMKIFFIADKEQRHENCS